MTQLSFNRNDWSVFGARELNHNIFPIIQSSLDLGHFERPLLQNLTKFTFNQDYGGVSLRDACIFLGPRLKTLHLTIPSSLTGLKTFTNTLKAKCPATEHLYISSFRSFDRANKVVWNLVCSLSALRTVSCERIICDAQALKYLSSLPSLQRLVVQLPAGLSHWSLLDASSNILPFPAMQHLSIMTPSLTEARELLQVASSASKLKYLQITFESVLPTPEELHATLEVIQQCSFCDTLTTFILEDHVETDEDATPLHTLDEQTLSPLLQCRNLEHIMTTISYGHAAIDNSLLEKMALAWPRLREINLHSHFNTHIWHSTANLQGLICLAQNCHSLQSVSLQFDVSHPPAAHSALRYESLTRLAVSCSHVSDPRSVGIFLANVFPNLRIDHNYTIRSTTPTTTHGQGLWTDFDDSLSDDEQTPEYMEIAMRWRDLIETITTRQELSQSQTNLNAASPCGCELSTPQPTCTTMG